MKKPVWVLADVERKNALIRVLEVHCETLKNRGSIKSHWPREFLASCSGTTSERGCS